MKIEGPGGVEIEIEVWHRGEENSITACFIDYV
jgi:hypothetical protein